MRNYVTNMMPLPGKDMAKLIERCAEVAKVSVKWDDNPMPKNTHAFDDRHYDPAGCKLAGYGSVYIEGRGVDLSEFWKEYRKLRGKD